MPMAIKAVSGNTFLKGERSIAPLIVFRWAFGLLMAISILRFWLNGWIEKLYLEPGFHFSYYGFQWLKPFGDATYVLFIICGLSALMLAIGWKYRLNASLFFISFTYIELMDKTTYLNHYYFVSLVAFIMIFMPAQRALSVDTGWSAKGLNIKLSNAYYLPLLVLVSLVYFYAGLAKLNSDWLLRAQPLAIWLPGKYDLPLIGSLLEEKYLAYVFSWAGALYDLSVPFLLWYPRSRKLALFLVITFHLLTRLLFPIGMFPFIMVLGACLFIDAQKQKAFLLRLLPAARNKSEQESTLLYPSQLWRFGFGLFIAFQLVWPWRYLAYPGELFWHEQGFRFSWRVMLMEKAGYVEYTVVDPETKRRFVVNNREFLSSFQEKQLSFQPDFILEFAHHLADYYQRQYGISNPEVYAEAYVALNGRPSRLYTDPNINLAACSRGWSPKSWILNFDEKIYGL